MGPMFPRLHVNDTEKGGPRAPPRNKMALYEQLSIPLQRFNTGSLPHNPNNTTNLTPSSSQGSGHERGMFFPLQLPPSVQPAEKPTHYADLNPSLVQMEPKKRQEEDFMVPIFVQSNMGQDRNENYNSMDKEKRSSSGTAYSGRVAEFQNTNEKVVKQFDTSGLNLRPEGSRHSEGNSKEVMVCGEKLNNSQSNKKSREKSEIPLKQINISSSFEHRDHPPKYFHKLKNTNDGLQHEYREDSQLIKTVRDDGVSVDQSRGLDYENSSILMGDLQQEVQRSPHNPTNDAESHEDNCRSLPTGIMDRGDDDVSETSMVDSVSGSDLSPDDVVGIIGQKHFWKARRAIVNQQRVFAVQVFELHRLIKVQKLIAESPHILLEDAAAYLGKTLKGSPAPKISLDYIVKATPKIVMHKDVSEKPDNRMESSAENAVEKTSISCLQNGSQPSNYGPFLGNPPQATVTSDTKMGPWGFNQPSGHQWLMPVMTPSEGLVYKPYPGPGFMGPVYGPPGSTPMMGSYLNYGVPVPHHTYQGLGPASFTPPAGHGYFPPFGMPVIHPSFSGSVEQTDHSGMQYQALHNVPSQKNGGVPNSAKLNPSKDSEVQFSMAGSPSERAQTTRASHTSGGKSALSLFPSPVVHVPGGSPDQPTRVIKVVPHNARSATESVARIFQSIQEERKQFDSI